MTDALSGDVGEATDRQPLTLVGLTDPHDVADVVSAATSRAFCSASRSRQRGPHHIGLSSLSRCTRAAAHALAGTDPSDDHDAGEGRAANLGTWEHAGLLPELSDQFADGTDERTVTLHAAGLSLVGHIDLDLPDAVIDLKTVGEWRLQAVLRSGAFADHIMQAAAYATAKVQAGEHPRWMIILYMDRSTGAIHPVVIPFTNRHVMMVIDRATELREWATTDPDRAPRRDAGGSPMYGPGFTFQCDDCPFMHRCWGDDARRGQRVTRQFADEETQALLLEYIAMNAAEGPAKRRKAEIVRLLEHTRYGDYGPVRYKRGQDSQIDDVYEAARMLGQLGYEMPKMWKRAPVSIKLIKPPKVPRRAKSKKGTNET